MHLYVCMLYACMYGIDFTVVRGFLCFFFGISYSNILKYFSMDGLIWKVIYIKNVLIQVPPCNHIYAYSKWFFKNMYEKWTHEISSGLNFFFIFYNCISFVHVSYFTLFRNFEWIHLLKALRFGLWTHFVTLIILCVYKGIIMINHHTHSWSVSFFFFLLHMRYIYIFCVYFPIFAFLLM